MTSVRKVVRDSSLLEAQKDNLNKAFESEGQRAGENLPTMSDMLSRIESALGIDRQVIRPHSETQHVPPAPHLRLNGEENAETAQTTEVSDSTEPATIEQTEPSTGPSLRLVKSESENAQSLVVSEEPTIEDRIEAIIDRAESLADPALVVRAVLEGLLDVRYVNLTQEEKRKVSDELRRYDIQADEDNI
jgi:hypothetical protein